MTSITSKRFNPFSLDAINFLLADVRGALGPYLNVFLVTQQHWSQSEVGLVTTIGGLLGLAVQTPIGAAIDETRAKRGAIVLALAVLGIGAGIIFAWPSFWPVAISNSVMAIVGDVFGPAVAALTLGLYARKHLARRMGRNSAFDHAGNVAIALAAGAVGYIFSQRAVFLLVATMNDSLLQFQMGLRDDAAGQAVVFKFPRDNDVLAVLCAVDQMRVVMPHKGAFCFPKLFQHGFEKAGFHRNANFTR
jgi:MFS family permease